MKIRMAWVLPLIWATLLVSCNEAKETQEAPPPENLPMKTLPLDDLSDFKPVGENWQIAGEAWAKPEEEHALFSSEGKGILVCQPSDDHKDNIFTSFEHGDIELELDVMVPKNSNSGVYLQGRYEVQVRDSWGKDQVQHGDMGGIYQRWDESRPDGEKGYEGHPPKVNASRAPGLWQHLHIIFHAPRFDDSGKKIANAYFEKVTLNGVTVQENVEVTGPTRAAAFEDEVPSAPIMLQGDHGPVAYKNIKYKLYSGKKVEVRNAKVQEFESQDDSLVDFSQLTPIKEMPVDTFSYHLAASNEKYALVYKGKMLFPESGDYLFKIQMARANGLLLIGGDTVFHDEGDLIFEQPVIIPKTYEAGEYDFTLIHNKPFRGWRRGLAVYVEGPGIQWQPLHGPASAVAGAQPEPIIVKASNTAPVLQRSFVQHGAEKRTHCINVGTGSGRHYVYDLAAASLLKVWDGAFLDATDMWHARGEKQLGVAMGPVVSFHGKPALVTLPDEGTAWPDSLNANMALRPQGYELDAQELPTFLYQSGDLRLRDHLAPSGDDRSFARKLEFQGRAPQHTYYKLAEGKSLFAMEDGGYAVDDFKYYLTPTANSEAKLVQRESNGKQELLLDLSGENNVRFEYEIMW